MLCLVCDACHSKYIELLQGIPPTQQIFFDFQRTSSFTKKIVFYHNKAIIKLSALEISNSCIAILGI